MSLRLPAPMQVEEGTTWSQPIPGVKELNDAQKDFLYGEYGAESLATEDPTNLKRVYTAKDGREKKQEAVALHQQESNKPPKGAAESTVNACMNSCAGAVYDFWHWNDLKGNTTQKFKNSGFARRPWPVPGTFHCRFCGTGLSLLHHRAQFGVQTEAAHANNKHENGDWTDFFCTLDCTLRTPCNQGRIPKLSVCLKKRTYKKNVL